MPPRESTYENSRATCTYLLSIYQAVKKMLLMANCNWDLIW